MKSATVIQGLKAELASPIAYRAVASVTENK